jgi:predicted exporter
VTPQPQQAAESRVTRLSAWLLRNRRLVLLCATLLATLGGWRTVLTYQSLRSELEELLPKTAPSVRALDIARARLPGLRSFGVVIDTGGPENVDAANRFVDALAEKVRAYPPALVSGVQVDITAERRFGETYAVQLMDPPDAKRLREAIEARRDWEVTRATGTDLLDEEEDPPPKVPLEELRDKYQKRFGPPRKYPNDRFVSDDGRTVVMLIRANSQATGYAADADLLRRVKADVGGLGFPNAFAPGMRIGYAGDVPTRVEEMDGLVVDLGVSGAIVLLLTVAVIVWYFRSFRSLAIIALPLLVGTLSTFGVVALPPLSIRYLNTNTAFLGSIIVGNGVNSGIMLLARFREERLAGHGVEDSIATMLATTWRPTLAAASAAAAAYGSLVFTDFRGFAQFGWIGGLGMLVCWAAAVLLIPVFASIWGERMPTTSADGDRAGRGGVLSVLFAHPRAVLLATLAVTAVSVLGLAHRGKSDWIEYDLSKLRRRDAFTSGERYWGKRMDDTMGRFLTPVVVLADDPEQARVIEGRLKKLRDEGGAGGLIASVRGPADVLPPERERSLAEAKLIAKALTPKLKEKLDASQREIVERATSPAALRRLEAEDLPPTLAAGLREKNGRMDRSVLLFPKTGGGTWDAAKLHAFARDLRAAAKVDEKRGTVTGALLLSADIASAMTKDGPVATALSLGAVLVICLLAVAVPRRRHLALRRSRDDARSHGLGGAEAELLELRGAAHHVRNRGRLLDQRAEALPAGRQARPRQRPERDGRRRGALLGNDHHRVRLALGGTEPGALLVRRLRRHRRAHVSLDRGGRPPGGPRPHRRPSKASGLKRNGDPAAMAGSPCFTLMRRRSGHGELHRRSGRFHGVAVRLGSGHVVDLCPLLEHGFRSDLLHRNADALGLHHGHAREVATADGVDLRGVLALVGAEVRDEGGDVLRCQLLEHVRRHDRLGHAALGDGRDDVALDVVLGAFVGQRLRQADDAQLGRAVVGLPKVAVQARRARRVNDASVAVFAQQRPRGPGHVHGAGQVDRQHLGPVLLRHLHEGHVAQDAGVVDDDVELAEGFLRLGDDLLGAFPGVHAVVVGHGLTARRLDLVDDLVGRCAATAAGAVHRATEIVDHHLGTTFGQQERVGSAQATPCTRDDCDSVVETNLGHVCLLREVDGPGGGRRLPRRAPRTVDAPRARVERERQS